MTDPTQSLRGGCWSHYPWHFCRSAYRIRSVPGTANDCVGFRVVCLPREMPPPRMMLRGGSWFSLPRNCRSPLRNHIQPGYAHGDFGFRVVCLQATPQDFTWLP